MRQAGYAQLTLSAKKGRAMRNLPVAIIHVLRQFEGVFSDRVWQWAKVLVVGAILAPGTRTVTAALRVMGLSQERQFQNYHRVLNRATWASRALSRILLRLDRKSTRLNSSHANISYAVFCLKKKKKKSILLL